MCSTQSAPRTRCRSISRRPQRNHTCGALASGRGLGLGSPAAATDSSGRFASAHQRNHLLASLNRQINESMNEKRANSHLVRSSNGIALCAARDIVAVGVCAAARACWLLSPAPIDDINYEMEFAIEHIHLARFNLLPPKKRRTSLGSHRESHSPCELMQRLQLHFPYRCRDASGRKKPPERERFSAHSFSVLIIIYNLNGKAGSDAKSFRFIVFARARVYLYMVDTVSMVCVPALPDRFFILAAAAPFPFRPFRRPNIINFT